MTDISVIKIIISVADEGFIGHGFMTKLRVWEGLGQGECFGHSSEGTIFVQNSKDLFLSSVQFISKSLFVSRTFVRFGDKRSSSGAFGFDDVLELFLRTLPRHRAFWKLPLRVFFKFLLNTCLFSKQSSCYLPDRYGDLQAKNANWYGALKTRMKT